MFVDRPLDVGFAGGVETVLDGDLARAEFDLERRLPPGHAVGEVDQRDPVAVPIEDRSGVDARVRRETGVELEPDAVGRLDERIVCRPIVKPDELGGVVVITADEPVVGQPVGNC